MAPPAFRCLLYVGLLTCSAGVGAFVDDDVDTFDPKMTGFLGVTDSKVHLASLPGGRKVLQIGGTTQGSRGSSAASRGGSVDPATPSTQGSSITGSQPVQHQPETRQAGSDPTSVGSQTQQRTIQPHEQSQVQQIQPQVSEPRTIQPQQLQPETRQAGSDPTSVGSQTRQPTIQPQASQPGQDPGQVIQPQVSQPQESQPEQSQQRQSGVSGTTRGQDGTGSSYNGQSESTTGASSGV